MQTAIAEFGHIDTLLNVAGVNRRMPAEKLSEDDYDFIKGVGVEMAYGVSKMFKKHPNTGTALKQVGVVTGFFSVVDVDWHRDLIGCPVRLMERGERGLLRVSPGAVVAFRYRDVLDLANLRDVGNMPADVLAGQSARRETGGAQKAAGPDGADRPSGPDGAQRAMLRASCLSAARSSGRAPTTVWFMPRRPWRPCPRAPTRRNRRCRTGAGTAPPARAVPPSGT